MLGVVEKSRKPLIIILTSTSLNPGEIDPDNIFCVCTYLIVLWFAASPIGKRLSTAPVFYFTLDNAVHPFETYSVENMKRMVYVVELLYKEKLLTDKVNGMRELLKPLEKKRQEPLLL